MKGKSMAVCEEFAMMTQLDCGKCHSPELELTGDFLVEGTGFYVKNKCKNCGEINESGDGEFLSEVAEFIGGQFRPLSLV